MNYLRAVKQSLTRGGKIGFIQSAAESEMQRKLTKSEFDGLIQKFPLDELYVNSEKVNIIAQWLFVNYILS